MHVIHNISNIHVNASFPKNKYRATGNAVTSLYFMKLMQHGHRDTLMYIYVCIHAHIQHTYTNRILFPFAKIIFSVFSFYILKKLFFENFFHKYNVFLSNPSPIPSSHNSSHTLPTTFPSQLLVCFFKHTESTMLPYLPECRFIRWNMSSLAEATS